MSHVSARLRSVIYRPGGCVQEVLTHYLLGHSIWACVLVVLLSSTPLGGGDKPVSDDAREEKS